MSRIQGMLVQNIRAGTRRNVGGLKSKPLQIHFVCPFDTRCRQVQGLLFVSSFDYDAYRLYCLM